MNKITVTEKILEQLEQLQLDTQSKFLIFESLALSLIANHVDPESVIGDFDRISLSLVDMLIASGAQPALIAQLRIEHSQLLSSLVRQRLGGLST